MFEIRFDDRSRIMHVRTEGFWSLATLATFSASALARFTATRLKSGHFATLVDCRDFPVQAGDVAAGLELIAAKSAKITTGPVATITANPLNKLQADRIMATPQFRSFLNREDAMAWLRERWPPARAAAET